MDCGQRMPAWPRPTAPAWSSELVAAALDSTALPRPPAGWVRLIPGGPAPPTPAAPTSPNVLSDGQGTWHLQLPGKGTKVIRAPHGVLCVFGRPQILGPDGQLIEATESRLRKIL